MRLLFFYTDKKTTCYAGVNVQTLVSGAVDKKIPVLIE